MGKNGSTIYKSPKKISIQRKKMIIATDALIRKIFINIPKRTENKTRFFLYSFFKGLKNVTNKALREKSFIKYLLNELKYESISIKPSLYQNKTTRIG